MQKHWYKTKEDSHLGQCGKCLKNRRISSYNGWKHYLCTACAKQELKENNETN